MGVIQNSLNTMLGAITGGVLATKHVGAQQAELKQTEAAELGKIENAMTEAELIANGASKEEAKNFNIANTLGLKVDPSYKARYDELQMIKSQGVLQSETYAKLQQDTLLRKRFTDLISTQEGREQLNRTMSVREKK